MRSHNEIQNENGQLGIISALLEVLQDKPTTFLFLIFSCGFVIFSVIYGRYLFESMWTLFCIAGMHFLMLARKQKDISDPMVRTWLRLLFLFLTPFILLFLFWVAGIIFFSEHFKDLRIFLESIRFYHLYYFILPLVLILIAGLMYVLSEPKKKS